MSDQDFAEQPPDPERVRLHMEKVTAERQKVEHLLALLDAAKRAENKPWIRELRSELKPAASNYLILSLDIGIKNIGLGERTGPDGRPYKLECWVLPVKHSQRDRHVQHAAKAIMATGDAQEMMNAAMALRYPGYMEGPIRLFAKLASSLLRRALLKRAFNNVVDSEGLIMQDLAVSELFCMHVALGRKTAAQVLLEEHGRGQPQSHLGIAWRVMQMADNEGAGEALRYMEEKLPEKLRRGSPCLFVVEQSLRHILYGDQGDYKPDEPDGLGF